MCAWVTCDMWLLKKGSDCQVCKLALSACLQGPQLTQNQMEDILPVAGNTHPPLWLSANTVNIVFHALQLINSCNSNETIRAHHHSQTPACQPKVAENEDDVQEGCIRVAPLLPHPASLGHSDLRGSGMWNSPALPTSISWKLQISTQWDLNYPRLFGCSSYTTPDMPDTLKLLSPETFTYTALLLSVEGPGTLQGPAPIVTDPESFEPIPMPCPLKSSAPGVDSWFSHSLCSSSTESIHTGKTQFALRNSPVGWDGSNSA